MVDSKENDKFDLGVKGLSRPIQILVILCDFDYDGETKYQPSSSQVLYFYLTLIMIRKSFED